MLAPLVLSTFAALAAEPAPPVRAFILAGQSNMVGHGFIAADAQRNGGKGSLEEAVRSGRIPGLLEADGSWRVRDDVWIHYFDQKGRLTVGFGAGRDCIGPEFGFGQAVGDSLEEAVLLVKIAWGGKSLAVDFRPPSSGGTVGPNFTELARLSREALAQAGKNFPEWEGRSVELAGFGWHQGWNDRINSGFVAEYEANMSNFIRDIRKELGAPGLPFVIAETGMGGWAEKDEGALALMKAQAAVAQNPDFHKNVAFVGTRTFWRTADESPSDQGYHWNNNGETYFLIGDAMGRAMVRLLQESRR